MDDSLKCQYCEKGITVTRRILNQMKRLPFHNDDNGYNVVYRADVDSFIREIDTALEAPIGGDPPQCPICGEEAVFLMPPTVRRVRIWWCSHGHVSLTIGSPDDKPYEIKWMETIDRLTR